jgi:hypothetical protein
MKLTITMSLDNAAFEDAGSDEAIRAITEALENMRGEWANADGARSKVRDYNGNVVGTAQITE